MRIITISRKELKNIPKYKLSRKISNTEGKKYRIEGDYLGNGNQKFIMKSLGNGIPKNIDFYHQHNKSSIYEVNKLYTIVNLFKYREEIDIEELCLACVLVILEEENVFSHFLVPEVENAKNLGVILKDKNISNEKKIDYLYQVGHIIDKVIHLDLDIKINIGDLREYNFIVDEEEKIHVVDTDSFYLHTGYPLDAYYLSKMPSILREQPKKYKMKINNETDLLCYISMVFNTLLNSEIHLFNKKEYYLYLDYLEYLGFGIDILECFQRIYTSLENSNPYDYLDQIPVDNLKETDRKSFQKYRRKKNFF